MCNMGKVILITGGTDGIGRAIVMKILNTSGEIDRLIINYGHNAKKANDLLEALPNGLRDKVFLAKADMSDYDGMRSLTQQCRELADRIDYVICNVGIGEYARYEDYTLEMWNRVIQTNLTIPVFLIKELRPMLSEGGSVLLMGSYSGKKGYSSSVVYSISKAGILFLSKVLVKELEPYGVRINALAPGFIETGWQSGRSQESRDRINAKIALHRFGTPEEVADMAVAVLTNGYMNGTVVDIHGGYEYF